jgi:hypothetical protein
MPRLKLRRKKKSKMEKDGEKEKEGRLEEADRKKALNVNDDVDLASMPA